ncbi:MAG TPA: sulfurtransferase [Thermoanaerobaculia bacterium]
MKRYALLALSLVLALPLLAANPNRDLLVRTSWLEARLRRVAIVHVAASREEYDAGHIPGARLLLWTDFVETEGKVPNEMPTLGKLVGTFEQLGIGNRGKIVLYGDDLLKTARAFVTLDSLGHGSRLALLDGGLAKWRAEGRALATVPVVPKPASFRARPHPGSLVRLKPLRAILGHAEACRRLALVDARPAEQFQKGRIGDAVNIFWRANLTEEPHPVLRSPDELERLYQGAHVTPDKTVITYCRTGVQASLTFFILRYLGYDDVALYDGSFSEWSAAETAP